MNSSIDFTSEPLKFEVDLKSENVQKNLII